VHKREGSPKFGFLEIDCCNLYIREVRFVFDFGTLDFKVFELFIFMFLDFSCFLIFGTLDFWSNTSPFACRSCSFHINPKMLDPPSPF
jgi:hypothetical protein